MEVIMATHTIKPSSPTPPQFKTHKLSSLDQLGPPIYLPLIFFYQNDQSKSPTQISHLLRQSLSEILTIFYPLAGTKHSSFVDCNDRGAEFVEARVHARLAHFIQAPKMEELTQLVPAGSSSYDDTAAQLLVKVSYFDCGGVSVGACFSHKIGDTSSFVAFMNAWAATCRGAAAAQIIHPSFDLALRFPPIDDLSRNFEFEGLIARCRIAVERLVFEREKLEKLRRSSRDQKHPICSRVEAVSAFIWRGFIKTAKAKPPSSPSSSASHMVNLRPRTAPPMPEQTFGNCVTFASASVSWEEDENDDDVLVSRLRAAIRAVDDKYIERVVKDESYPRAIEGACNSLKAGDVLFTSWVRFPVYEVDFGWGKPDWVCPAALPVMNMVILMSTPDGGGVEAWIHLPDDTAYFQSLQANYNNLFT